MAQAAIKGGLWIPAPIHFSVSAPAFSAMLIDASGEKAAFVLSIPKTGTLDKFEFRLNAVTQAPASGLRCAFQDVSLVNGDPDGTDDQFRVVTTGLTANTWVAPGLITSDGTDTGVKRAVTKGDLVACVVSFESFATGDSLEVSNLAQTGVVQQSIGGFPYPDQFTTAWTKIAGRPVVALKYNDGTYELIEATSLPLSALNSTAFNSGSTPDERGNILQFPFPVKVSGFWVRVDLDGDADVVLYDSDGTTALATSSLDTNVRASAVGHTLFRYFSSDVSLSKDTTYRLVLKPTSVTSVTLYDFDVNAAAIMDAVEGGQNWHHTQRTDAGAWSQTTTKRNMMGLLVTSADDGAGGGGILVHPGMTGGCRG
ncbi:hypothetical protein HY346_00975 [Candidatus Microgenomates bacterium]|nr:hypothetical protein [Candidatus Microgenomates bacterium]